MTRQPAQDQVTFSIAGLEVWAPDISTPSEWLEWSQGQRPIGISGEPALPQMPPMLRRHAGRLGKLACTPAYSTLGELRDVPMVFCARYGEVSRSVELLTALSAGQELSPTVFGLSVHNAVPGLFSMARKETANAIALAAGDDAAELGVIEACGLLADGTKRVLLVVADCPLPEIYAQFEISQPSAYGWSCIISPPSGPIMTLNWRVDVAKENEAIPDHTLVREGSTDVADTRQKNAPPLMPVPLLLGVTDTLTRVSGHQTWHWQRHG